MKKIIISLSIILAIPMFSQVKFGLKVSPNVSLTSVKSDSINFDKGSAGLRFIGGMFIDVSITDNVAFHLGGEYAPKKLSLIIDSVKSAYSVQYIQVPFGLKFYTNEFADRFKIYFLLDPNLAFKISEKSASSNSKTGYDIVKYADTKNKKAFNFFDFGINLGAGTEIKVGESTYLFGGLSYNRGLINTINPLLKDPKGVSMTKLARVTNGLVNLDLGIKF